MKNRITKLPAYLSALALVLACSQAQSSPLLCADLFAPPTESASNIKTTFRDRLKGLFWGKDISQAFDKYFQKRSDYALIKLDGSSDPSFYAASVVGTDAKGNYIILPQGYGPEAIVSASHVVAISPFMGVASIPPVVTNIRDGKRYMYVGFYRNGTVLVVDLSNNYKELHLSDIADH